MSIRQVEDTLVALLKDGSLGLAVTVERLAAQVLSPDDADLIRSDFDFNRWTLPGSAVRPATRANVMTRPRRWQPSVVFNGTREAVCWIDVGFESFKPDQRAQELQISITATALAAVMDQAAAFSDATHGTIIRVQNPIQYTFGYFESPTSAGFIATVAIDEVSYTE
jgi:hypothetical protein